MKPDTIAGRPSDGTYYLPASFVEIAGRSVGVEQHQSLSDNEQNEEYQVGNAVDSEPLLSISAISATRGVGTLSDRNPRLLLGKGFLASARFCSVAQ